MDISQTLLDGISDDLLDYGCARTEVEHFLSYRTPFLKRQREAIQLIENIMAHHGKRELLECVAELARVEHGIRQLEPWVRDHVVHALLSFLLGIYLNERFLRFQTWDIEFQWKLAGLLHDVGYPVQIAKDILRPYGEKINEIKRSLDVPAPDVHFRIAPVGIETLQGNVSSINLIQERLDEWGLEIDARGEYRRMIDAGEMCHGMISGLSVLYVLDLLYQRYNPEREYRDVLVPGNISWNQEYFEEDIVSACSAIFIHNLPARCFRNAKIDRYKAPIAFLLRLSDSLQDWDRPSLDTPEGLPATCFDIEVTNGGLIFYADVPPGRKDKIKEEIFSALDAADVQIP
jgi:hypothetical protein